MKSNVLNVMEFWHIKTMVVTKTGTSEEQGLPEYVREKNMNTRVEEMQGRGHRPPFWMQ